MKSIIEEGRIMGTIDSLTSEKIEIIYKQMRSCICKIYAENIGTGFFCKINYNNKKIPVLMTNYHIISDKFLNENKSIKISINNERIIDVINVSENDKLYSSPNNKYDIMIIKISKEKKIYDYLELDNNLFNMNSETFYEDKTIYILHYPMNEKISVSFGYGMNKLDEYNIKHFCSTDFCSSGGPILINRYS